MCKLNLLLAFPVNSDLAFWPSRKGNTTHAHSRSCKFDNEGTISEAPVKQNGWFSSAGSGIFRSNSAGMMQDTFQKSKALDFCLLILSMSLCIGNKNLLVMKRSVVLMGSREFR
ncbi:hypothetical protein TWF173_005785 [Orbilia oligospora]|uniref:Uncharacterized protein n=1 Tax=Orbilia oligospora TaxID=2813651 RepID=A0A7C8RA63_ORBOL|nr:hypothetical protein TWF970_011609 [Orbilia oligospora]KAF3313715.1 hypothetical protein TWF173_005785 [Orbilia oligospora]